VLLSLQLLLTREEEGGAPAEVTVAVIPPHRPAMPPSAPHRRPRPSPLPGLPPAPSQPVVMVDPRTGAGTVAALRRDLKLLKESGDPVAGTVVGLEIETLDQFRLVLGTGAADEVIRGLVEVAPFALEPRDRVYRFGRDKLIVWLRVEGADVEGARTGLEQAVTRFLADRGFPEVRLAARTLDPAAITRR